MTADFAFLAPDNALPRERAIERTSGERWDGLDIDVIRRARDPWTCPEHLLAHLAFQRSVDVWDEAWPTLKKRHVIARAPKDHRHKGTEATLTNYVRYLGGQVLKVTAPPQYTVLRHGPTAAERAAWLAQFQQVRIYPHVPLALNTRTQVLRHSSARSRLAIGRFPCTSRALITGRLRQARLYEPRTGEEVLLTRREIVREDADIGPSYHYEDLALKVRGRALAIGRSLRAGPVRGGGLAAQKTVRVRIARPELVSLPATIWTSHVPNGRLVDVRPELVRVRARSRGAAVGNCATGLRRDIVLQPNRAWMYVYERFYLFDRERDRGVAAGYPGSAIGRTRIAMLAHTARVKVRFTSKGRPGDLRLGGGLHGVLRGWDPNVLDPLLRASRASKALRDKIYIDTATKRKRRFGDGLRFGAVRFGETVDA